MSDPRPWYVEPGGAMLIDKYWLRVEMVPLHLHFDADDHNGERVCAWVLPEDVWRFTDRSPKIIPPGVLEYVTDFLAEAAHPTRKQWLRRRRQGKIRG